MTTSSRLVKGANQVLAQRVVDADLAAHRAVHLRQKRRRDVHERDAAEKRGGREPRGVANHASADGDEPLPRSAPARISAS